jgi:hypothetical protein
MVNDQSSVMHLHLNFFDFLDRFLIRAVSSLIDVRMQSAMYSGPLALLGLPVRQAELPPCWSAAWCSAAPIRPLVPHWGKRKYE